MQKYSVLRKWVVAVLAIAFVGNVHASSSFTSSATIQFTIDNITNLTNPGVLLESELGIFGSFEQEDIDGNVDPSKSILASIDLIPGTSFSHTFSLSDSVSDGLKEAYQTGYFGLGFANSAIGSIYQIELSANYLLSALGEGENADSEIFFDYFSDEFPGFSGFDYVNHSSVFGGNAETASNSGNYSLILEPGQAAFFMAQATITGNLYAAPVPLPGALWLFLSGMLAVFGLKKRALQSM